MRRPARVQCLMLVLLAPVPNASAACETGNESLEALGRGSLVLSQRYGIAIRFDGIDGNVFARSPGAEVVNAHITSNVAQLTGSFPVSRPYTGDGVTYSSFLFEKMFHDAVCPGHDISVMCSLVFQKSDESPQGTRRSKVACRFIVL